MPLTLMSSTFMFSVILQILHFISTDRPIIELSNSTLIVNEDSSVTLPCDVIANPPAYVQWFHNVHQVNVSDGEYLYGELCN